MAGTTILNGSLITGSPAILTSDRPARRTIDDVLTAVTASLCDCDAATTRRRSVLLIYSLYSLLMDSARYADKFLLPLHDPEGLDHGFMGVGDIAISDENGDLFECFTVLSVPVTPRSIHQAICRALPFGPERFFLLTTESLPAAEEQRMENVAEDASRSSTCEVIVDHVPRLLRYFLRAWNDPSVFLAAYKQALQEDFAEHRD